MKKIFKPDIALLLLSGLFPWQSYAQSGEAFKTADNSFEDMYRYSHPRLIYSYDNTAQTHNYSGNWDFDGDGQKDSLVFRGNGAVHLYYYLDVVLSSSRDAGNFPALAFDEPYLGTVADLEQSGREDTPCLLQFIVRDFDQDGHMDLYLNFNPDFSRLPHAWKKQGIHSGPVILTYKNKRWTVRQYKP